MTGTALAEVHPVDAAAFAAARDELVDCYAAVFCAPPWDEPLARATAFGRLLVEHAGQPGFTAALARDGAGRLVGFCYGFTTADPFPDHGCYATVRQMLDGRVEMLSGRREVVELAVHPQRRRGGLGRRLLSIVADAGPAWLITASRMAHATAFYERLGWRRTATGPELTLYLHPTAS